MAEGSLIMTTVSETKFYNLVEKRTLELIKRYDHRSFQELQFIMDKEYATHHFDITTIKLIVEALFREAEKLGVPKTKLDQLGLEAVSECHNGQLEPQLKLNRSKRKPKEGDLFDYLSKETRKIP